MEEGFVSGDRIAALIVAGIPSICSCEQREEHDKITASHCSVCPAPEIFLTPVRVRKIGIFPDQGP